jgi:serine/threonine protein kinase
LKPNNVLLCANGHIQLIDLGGVLDETGNVLGVNQESSGLANLFTQQFGLGNPEKITYIEDDEDLNQGNPNDKKNKSRRMSIMGTFGYMAPEMVIMLSQTSAEKCGYTRAVDWWSLGVTMFKLLTGFR